MFALKNDIVIGLCTTQAQVQPKYMITFNDAVCILKFEEATQMVDVKRSLEQMENLLGMLLQIQCTSPSPGQLKILHHRNNYSDSTLTASETQKEIRSQIEGALEWVVE